MVKGHRSEQIVLIAGASGLLATNIFKPFLQAATRSAAPSAMKPQQQKSTPSSQTIPNLTTSISSPCRTPPQRSHRATLDRVSGVIHIAMPIFLDFVAFDASELAPAIKGTENILSSISTHGHAVKSIVITSSFTAVFDATLGLAPGRVCTQKDWNSVTFGFTTENPAWAYALGQGEGLKARMGMVRQHQGV
jgi:nucleoside-diphosphate-sugar epimerase